MIQAPASFRIATLDDVSQLVELRILMQREVNATETKPGYEELVSNYFEQHLKDHSYLSVVAEAEGQLVAANGLVIYEKPPSITGGIGRVGYVTNVYTRVEWRGRGIATELMKLLISHARLKGANKLHLGATESGQRVYESVGFKTTPYPYLELKL